MDKLYAITAYKKVWWARVYNILKIKPVGEGGTQLQAINTWPNKDR